MPSPIAEPPQSTIRVDELRDRLVDAFRGMGVPMDEAVPAARVCLEGELLGKVSHGVRLAGNVSREYALGTSRRRDVEVVATGAASAVVDAGFHCSLWAHGDAARRCAIGAVEHGIAIVSVRNAGVSGALGIHAEDMARHGVCAVALNSAPSVVVAPGSAVPSIGTNPVAIAVPRPDAADPVVLDMATSAIAFNKVMTAIAADEPLPEGVAVDAAGNPTRDPRAALDESGRGRVLPFGGHRGFGLALMVELLTAAGVSHAVGSAKRGPELVEPSHFPGLYLAWRPDLVGDAAESARAVTAFLGELDADGVRVPGAQAQARRSRALSSGEVAVATESLAMLDRLASE